MESKFRKFLKDPKGYLVFILDREKIGLFAFIFSIYVNFIAWIWGITINGWLKTYGLVHFQRFPLSKIIIGRKCVFRSTLRSNFVGLNHDCCISTHSKNAEIKIGNRCGFSGVSISAFHSVTMGNRVLCGANSVITDFDWHSMKADGEILSEAVFIEDNVWLGMNCVVLKGVRIGENSIIGANSIVTKSIPSNVIAAGNPARIIRKLTSQNIKPNSDMNIE